MAEMMLTTDQSTERLAARCNSLGQEDDKDVRILGYTLPSLPSTMSEQDIKTALEFAVRQAAKVLGVENVWDLSAKQKYMDLAESIIGIDGLNPYYELFCGLIYDLVRFRTNEKPDLVRAELVIDLFYGVVVHIANSLYFPAPCSQSFWDNYLEASELVSLPLYYNFVYDPILRTLCYVGRLYVISGDDRFEVATNNMNLIKGFSYAEYLGMPLEVYRRGGLRLGSPGSPKAQPIIAHSPPVESAIELLLGHGMGEIVADVLDAAKSFALKLGRYHLGDPARKFQEQKMVRLLVGMHPNMTKETAHEFLRRYMLPDIAVR